MTAKTSCSFWLASRSREESLAYEEVYRAGTKRDNLIVIYRRSSSENLYYRAWHPSKGGYVKRSLGHSDLDAAKEWADEEAAKIRRGKSQLAKGRMTLARLFRAYIKHETPHKGTQTEKRQDERRSKTWKRVLGSDKDPEEISSLEWGAFARKRATGEIGPHGEINEDEDEREPVRPATVRTDLAWLKRVLRWGKHKADLISEVCVQGYELPPDPNPRRPVATQDRVDAIWEVYDRVQMEVTWGGELRKVQSFLPAVFELAVGTGRRIGAIRDVKYSHLHLDEGPHGKIFWPADRKGGREGKVAIPPRTRRALDAHRSRMRELVPSIGQTYVFPGARDTTRSISKKSVNRWLREAEKLAELKPHDGTLWHAYRRMWATARKHLPRADVAAAGGWAGPQTLERVYQQPDEDTMTHVVLNPGEVRTMHGEE